MVHLVRLEKVAYNTDVILQLMSEQNPAVANGSDRGFSQNRHIA